MKLVFRFAVFAIFFLDATRSSAQGIFIKIAGLPGNSTVTNFTSYYEVSETGQANIACATGACATVPGNFTFNMRVNDANPLLQTHLFQKTVIATVDIVYVKSSGTGASSVYYQIHLDNVIVKSIAEAISSDGANAQISFSPERIAWKYTAQRPDGTPGASYTSCWNTTTGTTAGCGSFPFK